MTAEEFYYKWEGIFAPESTDNLSTAFKFAEDYARFYGERLLQAEMKLLEFGVWWEDGKGYVFDGKEGE